jgi:hypothetical protein
VAQVFDEAPAGGVQVEVADLGVAAVAEPVDDERRHPGERPRRHRDRAVLEAQPERELAREHVEEVGVAAMDVQVRSLAARAEARPRRVQPLALGQDLHPPVVRVADDLASAGRDDGRLAHARYASTTRKSAVSPGA